MIPAQLGYLADACAGQLTGPDVQITAVTTDSRQLAAGGLFVALKGARFDAHDFIAQAEAAGAAAVLVSRPVSTKLPYILVPDTLTALGLLAADNRKRSGVTLVALTGSSGKTTVKQLLASILALEAPTLATQGNLNNEIGVPLTLLALTAEHRFAVVELGANHRGEIAYTAKLAQPQLALINNVMPAHLEGFGSIDGVAQAKSEIYDALETSGVALVSLDSDYSPAWLQQNAQRPICTFGLAATAEVRAEQYQTDGVAGSRFNLVIHGQSYPARLSLPGQHNVANATAAAAAAWVLGLTPERIVAGLAQATNVGGRLKIQSGLQGIKLIDDSYNANPGSMRAAIEFLASLPGKRVLLLGDMGELGAEANEFHAAVGQQAKACGIDRLYACGPLMQNAVAEFGGQHFDDRFALLEQVKTELADDWVVLVKGSRSARMDEVVMQLSADSAVEAVATGSH